MMVEQEIIDITERIYTKKEKIFLQKEMIIFTKRDRKNKIGKHIY